MRNKLEKYKINNPGPPEKRRKKNWHQIKCDRTKHRRFNEYRDAILATLRQINVCHQAHITMWLPENPITFSWGPEDFNNDRQITVNSTKSNEVLQDILNDHSYVERIDCTQDECSFNDINFSEIYETDGSWNKIHIRRIVHVMDCFRISHEAYHEMRLVSKGHLPPIWKISAEKKVMSEQLPYIKHPTVSIGNNL